MPVVSLLVVQGPNQGKRYELGEGPRGNLSDSQPAGPRPWKLGRGTDNDLRILDDEVSRQHARIEPSPEGWTLVDLGSANGTFVNGRQVTRTALRAGDHVQLGRTIFVVSPSATTSNTSSGASVSEQIRLTNEETDRSQIVGQFAGAAAVGPSVASDLQLLYRISEEAVRPSVSLEELLRRILDLTLEAIGADRGCMLVTNSRTDRIEPRVMSRRSGMDVNERMPISTGIVEYVIRNGEGVWTSDAQHDQRFDPQRSILQSGIREALCVPMRGRYELIGVIYVDCTSFPSLPAAPVHRFSEESLKLLSAIGRQAALAVENNRYQEALVAAERLAAAGRAITTLSHHVKNILQGVRGGSYLIDAGLKDGQTELVRKGWRIVERNQDRIYHLVMDMLMFGKERQPSWQSTQLNEVAAEVCDLMQLRAEEAGILLEQKLGAGIPEAEFDPELLHRAILNLVINALEALDQVSDKGVFRPGALQRSLGLQPVNPGSAPDPQSESLSHEESPPEIPENSERPRVLVSTAYIADSDELIVEVSDNGPGIEAEDVRRMFNLFESTKGARGTGLGLAVTQKILREHGGDVSVTTNTIGPVSTEHGTVFKLHWPAHRKEV